MRKEPNNSPKTEKHNRVDSGFEGPDGRKEKAKKPAPKKGK